MARDERARSCDFPRGLVADAGGALIASPGGRLVARGGGFLSDDGGVLIAKGSGVVPNNGGSIVGQRAGYYRHPGLPLGVLSVPDEQPVVGMSVALADARNTVFASLTSVETDVNGQFEIAGVPRGLTYTVEAHLKTPAGDIRVASLVASEQPVLVLLASTLALSRLQQEVGEQWGSLDESLFARVVAGLAQVIGSDDVKLACTATMAEQRECVFERIAVEQPELQADWLALATPLKLVLQAAQAIADDLRARPARVPTLASDAEPSPSPSPTGLPSPSPSPTPEPILESTLLPSPRVAENLPQEWLVSTLAGSSEGFVDGVGADARFNRPVGVVVDESGNLYVADSGNHCIRKVSTTGVVTTLAGSTEGYADGTGSAARFNQPHAVAWDHVDHLYVADTLNNRIRQISADGLVTTLAGSRDGYADGLGAVARFLMPAWVVWDPAGALVVSDSFNHRIRRIQPASVTRSYNDLNGDPARR